MCTHTEALKTLICSTSALPPLPTPLRTGSSYPTRDGEGHLLVTEYGKCRYKDNQVVGLQELPETAPPGQLPHSGVCVCVLQQ